MSQFYASIQGARGEATRTGGKSSGITGHVRGWDVGVLVRGRDDDGRDVFDVYATTGSSGAHLSKLLGSVSLSEDGRLTFEPAAFALEGVAIA
jgi:hypothetical protein